MVFSSLARSKFAASWSGETMVVAAGLVVIIVGTEGLGLPVTVCVVLIALDDWVVNEAVPVEEKSGVLEARRVVWTWLELVDEDLVSPDVVADKDSVEEKLGVFKARLAVPF